MAPRPEAGALPAGFHFSQGSLQDYLDCPRRFELKYIEQRAWPALVTEPALEAERRMLLGAAFHRLVQQHLAGLSPAQVESMLIDPFAPANEDLVDWWHTYLDTRPADIQGRRYVEYGLSAAVGKWRLVAKLDLLVIQPGDGRAVENKAVILDWKTSRPQKREKLAGSLQTRVYRWLTARCGASLTGGRNLDPELIEMVYWFAQPGSSPVHLGYNSDLMQEDENILRGLISEAACIPAGEFMLAASDRHCGRCVYRSLCGRGVHAGQLDEDEDSQGAFDLNFDNVEEISF